MMFTAHPTTFLTSLAHAITHRGVRMLLAIGVSIGHQHCSAPANEPIDVADQKTPTPCHQAAMDNTGLQPPSDATPAYFLASITPLPDPKPAHTHPLSVHRACNGTYVTGVHARQIRKVCSILETHSPAAWHELTLSGGSGRSSLVQQIAHTLHYALQHSDFSCKLALKGLVCKKARNATQQPCTLSSMTMTRRFTRLTSIQLATSAGLYLLQPLMMLPANAQRLHTNHPAASACHSSKQFHALRDLLTTLDGSQCCTFCAGLISKAHAFVQAVEALQADIGHFARHKHTPTAHNTTFWTPNAFTTAYHLLRTPHSPPSAQCITRYSNA